MDYSKIRIKLEEEVGRNIMDTIEGDIISNLIKASKAETESNYYKFFLEGHSFKVTKDLAPKMYDIFEEVCERLDFNEKIDFYITNSPELNASASYRIEDDEPHIININSGLIEKYDEDELKFVIGHEIGHILSDNIIIKNVINFVFPDVQRIPMVLYNKISLWDRLSELTADRYGIIASQNLDKCISAFFKLSSGLDLGKINFNIEAFLKENDKKLEYFESENAVNLSSHPVNPLRIKAIQYFFDSKLFQQIVNEKSTSEDAQLEENIGKLVNLLLVIRSSELDRHRSWFIASAGLVMAGIDEDINAEEYENILNVLSNFVVFPSVMLKEIYDNNKQHDIFIQSAQQILNHNPGERDAMFDFLVNVAISDKELFKKEINFLYETGEKLFNFSKIEVAQKIGYIVQRNFMPKLFN